jgi:hypothetical protein
MIVSVALCVTSILCGLFVNAGPGIAEREDLAMCNHAVSATEDELVEALKSLRGLRTPNSRDDLDEWARDRERRLRFLRVAHERSVPLLIDMVLNDEDGGQALALEVLSQVRDDRIIDGLAELELISLDEASLSYVTDACEINWETPTANRTLRRIVELERPRVSARAAWVLAHPGLPAIDQWGVWKQQGQ